MAMKSLTHLRKQLQAFRADRGGNIAIIFALASLPVVGLVGASVDYSRAGSVRADLQSALDATALMVSKTAATTSAADLQTAANSYFQVLFNRPEAQSTTITASYSTDNGSSVTVSGTSTVNTNFINIIRIPQINISASSTVAWGSSKLRVALVLDNTGSMADDNKLANLKTASKNLLKTLQSAAQTAGDVQVAIIPFANGVNVGNGNVNEFWIDWGNYSTSGGSGWGSNSSSSWSSSSTSSSYSSGNWSSSASSSWSSSSDKSKWQGCVMDRDQDYDIKNTVPNKNTSSTLYPAIYSTYCPAPMMPLSSDWTGLSSKIDSMVATGSTNQTIGLVWGWQALTPGEPFDNPAMPADAQQVIVMLTDGLNTENRWTTDPTKIDARTAKVCANIKAAGITLYTVQVKGNGDATSAILQNCATDSSKFFALSSGSQIVTTFNTIGTKLAQLRIAK
jgi:Flp pilus assembly protein TadG